MIFPLTGQVSFDVPLYVTLLFIVRFACAFAVFVFSFACAVVVFVVCVVLFVALLFAPMDRSSNFISCFA